MSHESDVDAKIMESISTSKTTNTDLEEKKDDMSRHRSRELETVVWPWMAVIANIPVQLNNRNLKDELTKQGYRTTKVHNLWNRRGHSGYAIVEFGKDWKAFANLMKFVKDFELNRHGKKDWYERTTQKDNNLYAWAAGGEDYNCSGPVGKHLKKKGNLTSASEKQKEDEVRNNKLVMGLEEKLEEKNKKRKEIQREISTMDHHMKLNVMHETYYREKKMMQEKENAFLQNLKVEHENTNMELEEHAKQLEAREAKNEYEQKTIDNEKKRQKKADDRMLKLAEDQKREKEKLHEKIIDQQKKIHERQSLELQIIQMKGSMEVMKCLTEGDVEAMKKVDSIREDLKVKEAKLESLEELNQALIVKERKSNDELQDACNELFDGLKELQNNVEMRKATLKEGLNIF